MLKYITEKDYKELLGTDSVPSNFNKLVIEASSYINYNTFGRIDIDNIPEEVKFTTCLIIEKINEKDNKLSEIQNLKSESIEGWSKTYATPEEVEKKCSLEMTDILKKYLWDVIGKDGNPLLYRGVL